jgi:hypothetical protein
MKRFLALAGLRPSGSVSRPQTFTQRVMKNLTYVGFLAMVAMLVNACGESSNPMTSTVDEIAVAPAAKGGGNGGGGAASTSNDGETAYSNGGPGDFVGFNETDCPDYGIYEWTLWAGKTNDAGTVSITADDGNLYVTYDTNETADLGEVHVYVWTDLADIPEKRPAPGHAPYTAENLNADSYTVVIPMATETVCGSTYYISTHAALVADGEGGGGDDNSGETAYAGGGGGFESAKGAWWGYVEYTVDCYYDISGTVYEDASDNSDLDQGDTGFEGILVNLVDAAGTVIATTTTDANGAYLFEHVAGGGDYSVQVVAGPADHYATENADGASVSGLSDCTDGLDFGFIPHFDISGTVAIDASCGDGSEVLPEVTITLTSDAGSVTVTTVGGSYSFADIRGYADYTITASVPAGFTTETGADGIALENLSHDAKASFTYCPEIVDPLTCDDSGYADANPDECDGGGPDTCETDPTLCDNEDDDDDGSLANETAYAGASNDNYDEWAGPGSNGAWWGYVSHEIGTTSVYTLWAGKHTDAGTVTITDDGASVYVTYDTNTGGDLGEVHVYFWTSDPCDADGEGGANDSTTACGDRSDNVVPGQADYPSGKAYSAGDADSFTVEIPFTGSGTVYISAHAALTAGD